MKVQSLSVVVPGGCPNKCKFCVSQLHPAENIENQIEKNKRFVELYEKDYMHRLSFARDNGCNTVMLTGDGEPIMNPVFLEKFAWMNASIKNPFVWIELQTSGIGLNDEKLRWLRNKVGVSTISLSLANVYDSKKNAEIVNFPSGKEIDIDHLCSEIKRYDFNLRLSLNLTSEYEKAYDLIDKKGVFFPVPVSNNETKKIFLRCKELGADQVTFRKLYSGKEDNEVNKWIKGNAADDRLFVVINTYIERNGHRLEVLPFGAVRYSVHGMSCLVDSDCMSTAGDKDVVKYMILRPNCKLYTKWDDNGSLLF